MRIHLIYATLVSCCGLIHCVDEKIDDDPYYYFPEDPFYTGDDFHDEAYVTANFSDYNTDDAYGNGYGFDAMADDNAGRNDVYDGEVIDVDYIEAYDEPPKAPPMPKERTLLYLVEPYRSSLDRLFNSSETSNDRVFNLLRKESYWNLQHVEYGLNLTMGPGGGISHLNASEVRDIEAVSRLVRERMVDIFKRNPKRWLIQSMHSQRRYLASAYSHESIFSHFHDVMETVENGTWHCANGGGMVKIWKVLIDDGSNETLPTSGLDLFGDHSSGIEKLELFYGLVKLAEAFRISEENKVEEETDQLKMKAGLINAISQHEHLTFLNRLVGKEALARWVEMILCDELSLVTLSQILNEISISLSSSSLHPEDISCIMKMQQRISQIMYRMNLNETEDVTRFGGDVVHTMLDSYMTVVDSTVDKHSADAWGQLPNDAIEKNLHGILLNTEQYVGVAADAYYIDDVVEIDKDILSLKISKLTRDSEAKFSFGDAEIEMDSTVNAEGMKVYSLRYKSWTDLMDNIQEHHNIHNPDDHGHLIKMADNKTFVNSGGIISFSARNSSGKQSVPVTFKIKIKQDTNASTASQQYGSEYRCMSCEFLDESLSKWHSSGCEVTGVDSSSISCRCNHTTNFAAFMMPAEITYIPTANEIKVMNILEKIGSWLSVVGLILSLGVFALVKNIIRNERLKVHIHLSVALLCVHVLHLAADMFLFHDDLCVMITALSHFFLLSTFMWMLIEGIFLYIYVVQVFLRSTFDSYRWMYVVGWFVPAVIVSASVGYAVPHDAYVKLNDAEKHSNEHLHECPHGSVLYPPPPVEKYSTYAACWLSTQSGMIWSFLGPALFVLTFNFIILCKTLQVCMKTLSSNKRPEAQRYMLARNSSSPVPGVKKPLNGNRTSQNYDSLHGEVFLDGVKLPPTPPILVYSSNSLLQVTTSSEEDVNEQQERRNTAPLRKQRRKPISSTSSVDSGKTGSVSSPQTTRSRLDFQSTTSLLNNEQDKKMLSVNENNRFSSRYPSVSNSAPVTRTPTSSINYRHPPVKPYRPSVVSTGGKMFNNDGRNILKEIKTTIKGTMILLPVLGVPWVCGVLSHLSVTLAFIFVILNTTQGLAIFIVYCLLNGEVRRALQRRIAVTKMRHSLRRTSSTSSIRSRVFRRFSRRRSTVVTSS